MKRATNFGLTLVLVLALGVLLTGFVFAQQDTTKVQNRATVEQPYRMGQGPAGPGRAFIDENGNGVCDRFEQGQAVGPRGMRGRGHGPNFIDENGDGVCDHYAAGGWHMGRGYGFRR